MPSDWYVFIDGSSCGPLDDGCLKSLAQEGKITPETPVSRAGMKHWVPAMQLNGLFANGQGAIASQAYPRPEPVAASPTTNTDASLPVIQTNSRSSRFRYPARPDHSINIMLGLGGAAALLLGFFCPILRLPIIGSMSYLSFIGLLVREGAVSEMTISAILVLASVGLSILVAVLKQPPLFWVPGISGCLAAVLTIGKYLWMQGEMASKMKQDLDGNPFAGLAQAMVQSVSLDFGIGIIAIGAALVIAGAVVPAGKRV